MHLRDTADLHKAHPDVYRKFKSGHFTEQKTKRVFSAIPIDQAHEQNNARMVVQWHHRYFICFEQVDDCWTRDCQSNENSYLENNGEEDTHHHDQQQV